MQTTLNEKERKEIIDTVASIVNEIKKDDSVDGILLTIYRGDRPSVIRGNILEFTVLYQNEMHDKSKLEELSKNSLDSGFNIVIIAQKYTELSQFEARIFNSSVLYDKEGTFTKKKKELTDEYTESRPIIEYGNLINIFPPIDDEVKMKLTNAENK